MNESQSESTHFYNVSNNTNTRQSQRRDSWGGNPVGLLWSSDLYFTLRFSLTGGVPSGRLTSGTDRTGRGATAGVDRKEERKEERKKEKRERNESESKTVC